MLTNQKPARDPFIRHRRQKEAFLNFCREVWTKRSKMTRKLQDQPLDDGKSRKRILKPVVEKKRRDRINQSLAELRSLLLSSTSDARLQNPKIEKAEILDLAVEYLKKWTDRKYMSDDSVRTPLGSAEPSLPPLLVIESAGFQRCVSQLAGYMRKVAPTQRTSLMEGLKHHLESLTSKPDFSHNTTETSDAASADPVSTSDSREGSPWFLFPSHSPFQSCSTPCHDYLSPPSSPWISPPFPTYAPSPPFPSFSCHFSSPHSLSPPSSNTFFFSVPPTLPHSTPLGLHVLPLTSLIPPSNPAHRQGSAPGSARWRPWL